MMEKLSVKEFDANYNLVTERFYKACEKAGKRAEDIILLAATKTVDSKTVNYAISKGINFIGENKVQEFLSKYDDIAPVTHHFIGHLQTNKVKDIIDKVDMIQSVDSLKLAKEISKQAKKREKVMEILLEVNIGGESAKWGFTPEDTEKAFLEIANLDNIKVKGLMTIPPMCENEEQLRKYFKKMYNLFVDIRTKNIDNSSMDILSMGMSNDFDIAIEEGANLVRIGTALFGKRYYM